MKFTVSRSAAMVAAFSLAIAFVAGFSIDCQAQEGRGRGGFRGGPPGGGGRPGGPRGGDPAIGLLRVDAVQEELKITEEQKGALQKLAESARPERPEGVNFREMSEEERGKFFEKMQKEAAERMKEMKAQLEEVLSIDQIDRLEQISLQQRGAMALQDPEITEKLGISEEQKTKLKETQEGIREEMQSKMRELFTGGDREGMREKFTALRKEMEDKVFGVLTDDQKKKFEDMKGEPFEMPEGASGWGGGRGGRGGDRAGRGGGDRGGRRGGGERGGRPQSE